MNGYQRRLTSCLACRLAAACGLVERAQPERRHDGEVIGRDSREPAPVSAEPCAFQVLWQMDPKVG